MEIDFTYYVTVADLKFYATNITEAVEICFFFFCSLNIKYPDESNTIWLFIQHAVFQLLSTDSKVVDLMKLLGI